MASLIERLCDGRTIDVLAGCLKEQRRLTHGDRVTCLTGLYLGVGRRGGAGARRATVEFPPCANLGGGGGKGLLAEPEADVPA